MSTEEREMKTIHEGVGGAPSGATEPVQDEPPEESSKCLIIVGVILCLAVLLAIGLGVGLGVDWDDDDSVAPGTTKNNVVTKTVLSMTGVSVNTAVANVGGITSTIRDATTKSATVTCEQFCQSGTCYHCNGTAMGAARLAPVLATGPLSIHYIVSARLTSTYVVSKISSASSKFVSLLGGSWVSVKSVSAQLGTERVEYNYPFGTAQAWGPDGRLYITSGAGFVNALTINSTLHVTDNYQVANLQNLGNQLIGLAIHPTSTATDIMLYVSGFPFQPKSNTGSVWFMQGSGSNWTSPDAVITGLPRSVGKLPHGVSGIHFNSAGVLYISSGGMTASGAEVKGDESFSTSEVPLSNAILTANLTDPNFVGVCYEQGAPYTAEANCTLGLYATGLRNSYDFVFHSNGQIYATDNGHQDNGAFPTSGTAPCLGYGNNVTNNPGDQPDLLLKIEQGKYYGHPNPTRDECTYYNGSRQNVQAPSNYKTALASVGLRASANGIIEYKSSKCRNLRNRLLFVRYATGDDVVAVTLSADGSRVIEQRRLLTGFVDPLSISERDGDLFVGTAEKLVAIKMNC